MKPIIGLLVLMLTSTGVFANTKEVSMQKQFRQMAEECQLALDKVPGYQLPNKNVSTLASCYRHKVKKTFAEARAQRDRQRTLRGQYFYSAQFNYGMDVKRMLKSALQAEPSLSLVAYQAALEGRVNPRVALQIATATQPQNEAKFRYIHGLRSQQQGDWILARVADVSNP